MLASLSPLDGEKRPHFCTAWRCIAEYSRLCEAASLTAVASIVIFFLSSVLGLSIASWGPNQRRRVAASIGRGRTFP